MVLTTMSTENSSFSSSMICIREQLVTDNVEEINSASCRAPPFLISFDKSWKYLVLQKVFPEPSRTEVSKEFVSLNCNLVIAMLKSQSFDAK